MNIIRNFQEKEYRVPTGGIFGVTGIVKMCLDAGK
jgi:hypothetical protein